METTPRINPKDLKALKIMLASPEAIRSWSWGEVKRAETINYRTQKPERDGLFCERIFGPVKDYECSCGRYKGLRHRNLVCDKCGVEVTKSDVRRERMGHIELAVPVAHIWYYKVPPSIIGMLLDLSIKELESILYYDAYIVVDPYETDLRKGQVLTEAQYQEYLDIYGDAFHAEMGAAPIRQLLSELDLEELSVSLRTAIETEKSLLKKSRLLKRLRVVEAFLNSENRPEWTILTVLPVIPPELRPLVPLGGGRFATSDVNDLYRRVITRNNRLKHMLELNAPEIILRNEKRMLQEAVDALLDNARRRRPVTGRGGRKLNSLSDILRGKKGLLRRNLLGKRVDYSGRSVIVVGPELKMHQVGLPKEIAVELFKPIIEKRLEDLQIVQNKREARDLVRRRHPAMWDLLEEVVSNHPVLLNRAPTLHRPSIQAFEPVLVEGKAIKIHPLVCHAYNADFDGDQMGVFVPLLPEAQIEAALLMLSPQNIMSPANGKPLASASQDMVIGLNMLTKIMPDVKGTGKRFYSFDEARIAYENGYIDLRAEIEVPLKGKFIKTTVGRILFNEILPEGMEFINSELDKKGIQNLVSKIFKNFGTKITTEFLDRMKDLGFRMATMSGVTFGIDDMLVPEEKKMYIEEAIVERTKVDQAYKKGLISRIERYQKILDIWTRATEKVKDKMLDIMKKDKNGFNPIYMMVISGARGNIDQVRQLAGMRGLMARPSKSKDVIGEFIETPVISNFKEGLNVLEYFISTHGARKGLSDTALKTADAGHLTRRLVDVAQEVVITMEDCGTIQGRKLTALKEGEIVIESLAERIAGRVALEDIRDPETGEIIVKEGEEISDEAAEKIEQSGIESVEVRSVLRCEAPRGVCAKCYGRNLATGRLVEIGEAVGVIAAQSIGEPGTQLTLRTFHTGGAAERIAEEAVYRAPFDGVVRFQGLTLVEKGDSKISIVTSKRGRIIIEKNGRTQTFNVPHGATLRVKDGQKVKANQIVCEWEPYSLPILCPTNGIAKLDGLVEGITLRETVEEGKVERVVEVDKLKRYYPKVLILDEKTKKVKETVYLVQDARLLIEDGTLVKPGDLLARVPREAGKTKDITGGLPRVEQLFEARTPKDKAIVAEISGRVKVFPPEKGIFRVLIQPDVGDPKEYKIPYGRYLLVNDGEYIEAGEPITTGPIAPQDILRIRGSQEVQEFLLDQIQEVYRLSGVRIADKHIEIIVRQMMRKVQITDPGNTKFVQGDIIDAYRVDKVNRETVSKGGRPATYKKILVGITRASLETDSFIAAASFQETTKVLANAAIAGKVDELLGLKENVIIGSLVPSGTGMKALRKLRLVESEKEVKAAS